MDRSFAGLKSYGNGAKELTHRAESRCATRQADGEPIDSNSGMTMRTATKTLAKHLPGKSSAQSRAEGRVKAEIASMLQINGNTPTAHGWVPRVVMMAYERRCANNPADPELAECFSVAQAIAGRS